MLAPPGERHFGRECVAGSFQLDLLDVAGRAGDKDARIREASAELARHVDDVASLLAAGNPRERGSVNCAQRADHRSAVLHYRGGDADAIEAAGLRVQLAG